MAPVSLLHVISFIEAHAHISHYTRRLVKDCIAHLSSCFSLHPALAYIHMRFRRQMLVLTFCLCAATMGPPVSDAASGVSAARRSVVKIYVTMQRHNYALPWQSLRPMSASGSGYLVSRKRILTNAHVVSDARFIEVQKSGDATRYPARVGHIGHDCDIATLEVDDPAFFEGLRPVSFAKALPQLNDQVSVVGYPMGGARLSITKGVVSRIDYSVYSHSGMDQHLVLQVDAAINPGNSGGPVFFKDKVVGMAFQGLRQGDNIGYAIPVPVIQRFLADIVDGEYHGYPELGLGFMHLRNDALRKDLGLPEGKTGVAVYYTDPFASARGHLQERDVLLAIDGLPIDDDGSIQLDGNSVEFAELVERKQHGQSVEFSVWRDKDTIPVTVPIESIHDPYLFRLNYDKKPEYLIVGGLTFCPITQEYLRTAGGASRSRNTHQLIYYTQYAKIDDLHEGRDQFIVLAARMPHPVNTYDDSFMEHIVSTVNGRKVANLTGFKEALDSPVDGYIVIEFEGKQSPLVMDAKAAAEAMPEILSQYGIPSPEHITGDK